MFAKFLLLVCCILQLGINVYSDQFQCINDTTRGKSIKLLRQKPYHHQKHIAYTKAKENKLDSNFLKNLSGEKRTNDSVALYQYSDNEFYAKILVGRPGQEMNVAFDTSWTISWLLSSRCPTMSIPCRFHNKYNHDKSTKYVKDGRQAVFPEGNANYSGFYSFDHISIAHSNVSNQSFVEIDNVPFSFIFNKIDGIMGLGLQNDPNYKPLFYNLLDQNKIENKLFSIYLNRDTQSHHGGNVMLGFVECRHVHHVRDQHNDNKTVYDQIKYLRVKPGQYWKFDLEKIFFTTMKNESVVFCNQNCEAITDTSGTSIIGPEADVNTIHDIIDAKPWYNNRYSVNCNQINKLPPIHFQLDGQNFTLKGRDYTAKFTEFEWTICLSAFIPAKQNNFWVLGGGFLAEYYSIYDLENRQIGFVKAA